MKDSELYKEAQRELQRHNMNQYGFYDEPRDPKINLDWGDMLKVNNGMLSPDSAMRAHFEQNTAVQVPTHQGSPEKRAKQLSQIKEQEYDYQQGIIDSYCPDPIAQKEANTISIQQNNK